MVYWINHLPCKPGIAGSIPGFTSLSDATKRWPHLHMILAIGRTFTLCMLCKFSCFCCCLLNFFQKKKFQEICQSVKQFGFRSGPTFCGS